MRKRLPVRLMAFLWLATYVVCIGLVCSFILFEVLDIDGSDFPTPPLILLRVPILRSRANRLLTVFLRPLHEC